MEKHFSKNCPKCGENFEVYNKYNKKFCSRKCANSRIWSENDKLNKSISAKKSENVRIANSLNLLFNRISIKKEKVCPICNNIFLCRPSENKRIYCSKDCYLKDSTCKFRKNSKGGYRKGSGIGKSGWYKGIWCDSSYELAWVIYNLEHNEKFERNKEGFNYVYNNETHNYFPDFIKTNIYYEIKGYIRKNDKYKFKFFPHKLRILYRKNLNIEFEYVIKKYGKNFIELYEGNPHKIKKNKCQICGEPAKNVYCSRKCSGVGANKLLYKVGDSNP